MARDVISRPSLELSIYLLHASFAYQLEVSGCTSDLYQKALMSNALLFFCDNAHVYSAYKA